MFDQPYILVASDFSHGSDLAIKAGEELRIKTGGRLHVVHIAKYPQELDWLGKAFLETYVPENYLDILISELNSKLHSQLKRCEVHAEQEIVYGQNKILTLKGLIQQTGVDIIILGHNSSAWNPWHLGGFVSKVVSTSKIPVMVVKKEFQLQKIASLIDPANISLRLIKVCEEISRIYKSRPFFISLLPDLPSIYSKSVNFSTFDRKEMEERTQLSVFKQTNSELVPVIKVLFDKDLNPNKSLSHALANEEIDLALVQRNQTGLIEKFLMGSQTRNVLENFEGNILVLPPNEESV